ncbi:hypothetical protein B0J13DRAFT_533401 [Dactylonectria estremocensis]|uniref:Uncharacterized protein n=1 Tax=Dactylonectria estremocensis TaxID=1079267 RepID=A0A9P9ID98_9HYPO|nr:hypothetical protein B0J13DRAFT_533401 [Dactylonectria estremocensis]
MTDADDELIVSHYPKRKRISLFNDLGESKIEIPKSVSDDKPTPTDSLKPKPARPSLSNVKGAILGYWRDSPTPDERCKHAVIGFIDVRDRLQTRIQAINSVGESVTDEHPLPPCPLTGESTMSNGCEIAFIQKEDFTTFLHSTFISVSLVKHPDSRFKSPPADFSSSLTKLMLTKRGFETSRMYHLKRTLWITDRIDTAIRARRCP